VKILFPTSGAVTVRFPVLLWQKEYLKSVFGLASQAELPSRSFNIMADQSTNRNSTASLAPPPAVYILGDVEAGMNCINIKSKRSHMNSASQTRPPCAD
jgi:hypothetical protein